MPILRDLLIKVGFYVKDKDLLRADSNIKALKYSVFGLGAAIIGAAASMFALAKGTAETAFEFNKLATSLGIPIDEFQLLAKAAELIDVDVNSVAIGMRRFGIVTGQAIQGNKQALKGFAELGITSFKNINGSTKTQIQLLQEVADRLTSLKNPQEKLQASFMLFGRSFMPMMTLLSKGSAGLREYATTAKSLSYIFTPEDIQQSIKFKEQLNLVKIFIKGIKDEVISGLLPAFNSYMGSLVNVAKTHKELIAQEIHKKLQLVLTFLKSTYGILDNVFSILGKIINELGGLNRVLSITGVLFGIIISRKILMGLFSLIKPIVGLARAFFTLDFAASLIPDLLIAIGALSYLAYEDIEKFRKGNESFIGDIIKKYPKVGSIINSLAEQYNDAMSTMTDITDIFNESIRETKQLFVAIYHLISKVSTGLNGLADKMHVKIPGSTQLKSLTPEQRIIQSFPMLYTGAGALHSIAELSRMWGKSHGANVNNTFNFNIPPGTPDSQQDWFRDATNKWIQENQQDQLRALMNAHPLVEY